MPQSLTRVAGIVGISVVLMSLGMGAQQRWYELYDDGVAAFKKQQWAVAEQRLKAALALKPAQDQGQRVLFYGTRREPYLPEFYLAQVYLKLGRTKDGADLFAKIQREGRITARDPQFKALTALLAGIPAPPPVVAGNPGVPPAGERGASNAATPGAPITGATPPGPLADASRGAGGGAGAAPPGTSGAGTSPPTGTTPPPVTATPDPPADSGSPPLVAATQAADIERNGLLAFYRGQYQQALLLLESAALKQNPTPRRLFYIACSNAALGLLEGEKGNRRLVAARNQFAQARGFDAQFARDRRYVSPKILATLNPSR